MNAWTKVFLFLTGYIRSCRIKDLGKFLTLNELVDNRTSLISQLFLEILI